MFFLVNKLFKAGLLIIQWVILPTIAPKPLKECYESLRRLSVSHWGHTIVFLEWKRLALHIMCPQAEIPSDRQLAGILTRKATPLTQR